MTNWARQHVLGLASVASALVIITCAARAPGFLSGDSGVKYAQADSLWQSGFSTRALVRASKLDLDGAYFPYGAAFRRRVDGKWQGIYSVAFASIAAPAVGVFGRHGAPIVPVIGSLLAIFGFCVAGRRLAISSPLLAVGIPICVLLTPIAFYATQFAEHTFAVGLTTLAFGLVMPREGARSFPTCSGALVAAAACFRPEAYCLVASLGLALAAAPGSSLAARFHQGLRYLAGATALLGGYWLLNWLTASTWDPSVAANAGKSASLTNAVIMLFGDNTLFGPGIWVGIASAAAILSVVSCISRHKALAVLPYILAGALCLVLWQAQLHSKGRVLAGLFSVTPLLALGVLGGPWRRPEATLWLASVLFVVMVLGLDKSGTGGGLQVGARLLMPAVPMLVLLVLSRVEHDWHEGRWLVRSVMTVSVAALVAVSVRGVRLGTDQAGLISQQGVTLLEGVSAQEPSVVITRRWWESQLLAPIANRKEVLHVRGDLSLAIAKLAQNGVSTFVYVGRFPGMICVMRDTCAVVSGVSTSWLSISIIKLGDR